MSLVSVSRKRLSQSVSPCQAQAATAISRLHQQQLWRTPFTHLASPYSTSSAASANKGKTRHPSVGLESSAAPGIKIMSVQDYHRRATRSGAPSFDPSATAFVPAPDVPIPPPGWQPHPGQGSRPGNQVPLNRDHGANYTPQGALGNYTVYRQPPQHLNPAQRTRGVSKPKSRARNSAAQSTGLVNDPDIESDASSNPSVGAPLPRLTPDQMKTVTIPILGKPHSKVVTPNKKKRPYMIPSKASGGVPNPTKQYVVQSAMAPSLLPQPRNILVVIDLNGTLLHRPNHKKTSTFVERPYTRTFLDYCLKTFTVAIWSSAKPDNVRKMVPQILSPQDQCKLVAVWGRDTLGLSPEDYNQRVQVYKRLESIWDDPRVAASHPEARDGKRWDQTNTVLIDDSKEKARSQPYNIIQLPEFQGDTTEPGYVLPQVHNYLNDCAYQRDISSFIRENPFKFDPSWQLHGPNDGTPAEVNHT